MRDGERLARVLLDHARSTSPSRLIATMFSNRRFGGDRREAGGRLVQQQHARLDHQRHRHGQDLALAAGERARAHAGACAPASEIAPSPGSIRAVAAPRDRHSRPSRGSRAPTWSGRCCAPAARRRRRGGVISRGARPRERSAAQRDRAAATGCSSPAMDLSSVDLPAPFGPMMQTISPVVDARNRRPSGSRRPRRSRRRRRTTAQEAHSPPPHVGFLHRRVGGDLGEAALGQTAPLRQHDDVIAEPRDRVHVMLDQQDGDALGDQRAQMLADLARERRVDAGDRLVEQDQLAARPSARGRSRAASSARRTGSPAGRIEHARRG